MLSTLLGVFALSTSCQLATRTGQAQCWAQYSLGEHRRLCVSRQIWLQYLSQHQPTVLVPDPATTPKIISPPLNEVQHHAGKKTVYSYIQGLPQKRGSPNQLGQQFIRRIELLRERSSRLLQPSDRFGVLRNLLLGERTPQDAQGFLRYLGFVHLSSASGIHLYALSSWSHLLVRTATQALKIAPRYGLWFARFFSTFLFFSVWLLNGARLGLLRPWIVLLAGRVAEGAGIRWRKGRPLFLALLLEFGIALHHSCQTKEPLVHSGRWIYALAVGGGMIGRQNAKFPHLGMALGSWVLVAVWDAWENGTVALATAPLSLLTLPLITLVIYPLSIAILGISTFNSGINFAVDGLGYLTSKGLFKFVQLSIQDGNFWIVSKNSILIGMIGAVPITLVWQIKLKPHLRAVWFGIFASLLFLRLQLLSLPVNSTGVYQPANKPENRPANKIEQLDIGQGDAALVQVGETFGLVDTGSARALKDEAWLRLFSQRGVTSLAWIALTHLDEDHQGGLSRLARLLPIQCVTTSLAELTTQRGEKMTSHLAELGIPIRDWNAGCFPFPFQSPKKSERPRANARMSAIWIPLAQGGSYFSAGDADSKREAELAEWASTLMKQAGLPRILKVSHHGSKSSSNRDFLKSIQPTEAWISSGVGNRYHHPRQEILYRLARLQISVRRTDQEGSLKIEADPRPRSNSHP